MASGPRVGRMIALIGAGLAGVLFVASGVALGDPSASPARVATLIQADLKVVVSRPRHIATDVICRAPSTGRAALTITSEYRCTYWSAGFEWTCSVRPGALAIAGGEGQADVRTYLCAHPL
jgi:hypothetical protein